MRTVFFLTIVLAAAFSCSKPDMLQNNTSGAPVTGDSTKEVYRLNYGDSIFYISSQSGDVLANPVHAKKGSFSAFPEGLAINNNTGVINVSQSESGMRYRVTYKGDAGDSSSTYVVISGINFPDKYYRIESADTLAFPVYNADPARQLPAGSFDDDKVANNSGCAMRTTNGQINLAESIRRGLFGNTPKNDTRKDFEIKYQLDDKSRKAQNKIKILLYYYDRMSDVPADLRQTVQDHLTMTLRTTGDNAANSRSAAALLSRPRPPCIIIIGHNF